jgi:hypothetical protein
VDVPHQIGEPEVLPDARAVQAEDLVDPQALRAEAADAYQRRREGRGGDVPT